MLEEYEAQTGDRTRGKSSDQRRRRPLRKGVIRFVDIVRDRPLGIVEADGAVAKRWSQAFGLVAKLVPSDWLSPRSARARH